MNDSHLKGATAVVTGASSGIGRQIALRLGAAGATVYLAGRSQDGLEETAAAVQAAGAKAIVEAFALEERGAISRFVERASQETGRMNVMVNNAGVMVLGTVAGEELDILYQMIDVNIVALVEGSHAAIRAMRSTDSRGHIVNISSLAGQSDGRGVYGATKVAVDYLGRSMRLEIQGDDIRLTNIVPGAFSTNLGREQSDATKSHLDEYLGRDQPGYDPNQ
ncbi:SDR family NAD(P)-dependent oxidoreductase, partial [Myxococcota bacterium]|nr:SDR family NAD(P)-dependent oxidoreductase [Myxococcota bacterium]